MMCKLRKPCLMLQFMTISRDVHGFSETVHESRSHAPKLSNSRTYQNNGCCWGFETPKMILPAQSGNWMRSYSIHRSHPDSRLLKARSLVRHRHQQHRDLERVLGRPKMSKITGFQSSFSIVHRVRFSTKSLRGFAYLCLIIWLSVCYQTILFHPSLQKGVALLSRTTEKRDLGAAVRRFFLAERPVFREVHDELIIS